MKINLCENHVVKMHKGEGHKNKKKADTFLHVQTAQQRNDELFHRLHPIAHELNLKINTSLSLITPVLAFIETLMFN